MRLLTIFLSAVFCLPALSFSQTCENGDCVLPDSFPVAVDTFEVIERQILDHVQRAQSRGPSDAASVQVTTGGGCGSGHVCGRDSRGTYILTNAHVAGTRVGREVNLRGVVNGVDTRAVGTVILAAYSDRTLTDWAVVLTQGFADVTPVGLATTKPVGDHYTRGSPRCVWPLVSTSVITADIADDSPLWRWRPDAIGGQSGSGVFSIRTGLSEGLLTWSWGRLGAGQQTSEIYRQSKERSIEGVPRIAGLQERWVKKPNCNAVNPVIVESGFFAQAGITDLPIWGDTSSPADPEPEDDSVNWSRDGDVITIRVKTGP